MLLIILSLAFLFFWWKSPDLRSKFWILMSREKIPNRQPIESSELEVIDDSQIYQTVKTPMEKYLEMSRRKDEKMGPAIDAQGEVMNEWTSPSLEQFKELYQQGQIGGK